MSKEQTLPEPPDLTETVFAALEDKAALSAGSMLVLGVLAGVYVGFGALFATVALAGADGLPFGAGQVLAGLVFALGLALVLIAGAELFTGNTLMAGPLAAGRVGAGSVLRAWGIVYAANFAGSLLLAVLALASGLHEGGNGAVGRAALDMGAEKTDKSFGVLLASGVLANMLVCLAVWMAYGGNTVTEKIAGLILPIAAFVAAGLEHSIANMYILPYAWLIQGAFEGAAAISVSGILGNLVPVTLGNIVGGSLVALAYGHVYAGKRD